MMSLKAKTLKASPLRNRGYERREHPRHPIEHNSESTLKECPIKKYVRPKGRCFNQMYCPWVLTDEYLRTIGVDRTKWYAFCLEV